MFKQALSKNRRDLLELLVHNNLLKNFYLAGGCRIADLRDIALMKITAISGRGSKKDFIDLYFIIQDTLDLTNLFRLFAEKYKHTGYSTYHLIKSIGYFEDADKEKDPIMLQPLDWDKVKQYFLQQQKQLFEDSFGRK